MKILMGSLIILGLLAIGGCDNSTEPAQSSTGTLRVLMVDNAAAYDQVNVAIDSVQAHSASGDTTSGWVTLNNVPTTYDLLKLVNGANALIGSATLPAGSYSQIRLYVGSGSTVVVSGVSNALTTPSGSQSGIKLNVNAVIQPDFTYDLTIDFDAAKSIVKTGNPNSPTYNLKPVIRALATANSGAIAGIVSPGKPRSMVYAALGTDTLTTFADTTGAFKFPYLTPGLYGVSIISGSTLYRDTVLAGPKTVSAGATTNLGTIGLSLK